MYPFSIPFSELGFVLVEVPTRWTRVSRMRVFLRVRTKLQDDNDRTLRTVKIKTGTQHFSLVCYLVRTSSPLRSTITCARPSTDVRTVSRRGPQPDR